MPASVLKVMPAGVMLVSSRLTTMMPLASGMTMAMHSKQPQAVMGFSMMEYIGHFLHLLVGRTLPKSLVPVQ